MGMYISLWARSVEPEMTDRVAFPPSSLWQVSILQLLASQPMPDPSHGVVWHRWCVYTPIDCVITDRWLRGGGGGAAGMVFYPLSLTGVLEQFSVFACGAQGETGQVRGTGLQYKQNLG